MSNTEIKAAPIDDAGPIGTVPKLVGICTEHGWWFEAKRWPEGCPQAGCYAPVHLYVWRHEHKPEDPRDELDGESIEEPTPGPTPPAPVPSERSSP